MKTLNIGLVGYGFMGRAHSNAFRTAPNFFDLPYRPVLKFVCARNPERAKAFAEQWGYENIETDWRKLVASPDIGLIAKSRWAATRPKPRRWSPRSKGPAYPTWSGTTTGASRPSRWRGS